MKTEKVKYTEVQTYMSKLYSELKIKTRDEILANGRCIQHLTFPELSETQFANLVNASFTILNSEKLITKGNSYKEYRKIIEKGKTLGKIILESAIKADVKINYLNGKIAEQNAIIQDCRLRIFGGEKYDKDLKKKIPVYPDKDLSPEKIAELQNIYVEAEKEKTKLKADLETL